MGQLSAPWLTELLKNVTKPIPLLSIGFPGATMRVASGPVNQTGTGVYIPKSLKWGRPIERFISDRDGVLQTPQTSAIIEDSDNTLLPILEAGTARGSSSIIQVAHESISPFTVFGGGILSHWTMAGPTSWELFFRYRDQPLLGKGPRTAFMSSDWPNADGSIYSKFAPMIYGVHDSTGSTSTGAVPTFLVDKSIVATTPVYAVCLGWAQSVDRVFSGGVLKTLTTDYTIQHPVVNGRQWTTINFVAGHGPASTVAVTADVHGYESVGNGTGTMLQGSDQIRHALENFWWGNYQSGLWLTPSNTLASAFATTKTYCTQLGYLNSRWIGGDEQAVGMDELAKFLVTNRLFAFWTVTGQLAILPNDLRDATVYYDAQQWIAEHRGEMLGDSFRVDYNRDALVDSINARYLLLAAAGDYQKQIEVRQSSISENATETMELAWSQAA